jgi:two-component system phosphate regulon sensor histidine kinase PhoR
MPEKSRFFVPAKANSMKINHIAWLIAAAALAILALIGFQVSWMQQSRKLLEEQFNNRVNMALCSTVEKIAENQAGTDRQPACCSNPVNIAGSQQDFETLLKKPEVKAALAEALHFYQIDMPYQVQVARKDTSAESDAVPFSCSLQPVVSDDNHLLQLVFPDKSGYYLQRMGFMITSSVAILLFICIIFGLATYYLLWQKRLSDRNRDFFNHMTHEFRTPLTNIRLAGNLMARKNPDLGDNQYLGIIRRECDQLTHQVENVLYLAGLEKGDYQLQKQPVDLKRLAQDVVAGMELQLQERAAQVSIDTGTPAFTIEGDAFHLGNAFRNLLDNALKYTKNQPEVAIGFHPSETGWRVSFADNGMGLTPKNRRKIFQKFHRCEDAVISGEKGFGLGLAYVKKIVEMHRGHVTVSSENGKGSRFDLFFPA